MQNRKMKKSQILSASFVPNTHVFVAHENRMKTLFYAKKKRQLGQ